MNRTILRHRFAGASHDLKTGPVAWLAVLVVCYILPFLSLARGETPPEQMEAIKAISRVRSNVQLNRDGTVRFVRFSKSVVTDEHLVHLRAFRQLDYLAVVTPTVTDKGLAHIADLTNLDTLFLSDSGLTNDGVPSLRNLTKLQRLYLARTAIDDTQLSQLEMLKDLRELVLDGTAVTDEGLAILRCFPELEVLSLADTKISDDSYAVIAESCPKLQTLNLARCGLTAKGIEALARIDSLVDVSLQGNPIESHQLEPLAASPPRKLKYLDLTDTGVTGTDEALAAFGSGVVRCSPQGAAARNGWQRFLEGEPLQGAELLVPGRSPTAVDSASTESGPSSAIAAPDLTAWLHEGQPNFQRHVVPLLGRLGCNGRSCHGSFQGQGGFQLSMFGYDFQADWTAIAGGKSPRVDVQSPADSLLLTHPTTDDHGGGVRFSADGWEARLLTRWIEAGAPGVEKPAKLVRVEVTPDELLFNEPGQKTQLQVVAVWADGRREDVTKLARFQTNDDAVVKVDGSGLVEVVGKGDTWVITYYDSAVIATQCFLPGFLPGLLPGDRSAPAVSGSAESPIDHFIQTKLDKLGIEPSGPASDAEFLRRVSLDIAGTLPSPEEVREFLADTNPQKRASKIDQLLASPAYAQWWSMWLSDLTGSNSQYLGTTDMNTPAAGQWNGWLRRRVQDNVGWDKIAAGILLATSRKPGQSYTDYAAEQSMHMKSKGGTDFTALDQPMHYYWFRSNNQVPSDRALSFGYVFLGVRLQCAQCHKHPFDQWSKEEFDQFTNFFDRVKIGIAPESRAEQSLLKTKLGVPKKLDTAALRRQMYLRVAAEGLPIPWNEVWIEPPRPKTAKLLGGPVIDLSQYDDPREPLVAWLTSEQNPYFAKAFVNRVWARYMGVGIVDPPDDFNRANPPSHRDLLDWLAESFIEHNYDMQWLHRTIANSEAYQRSWRPTPTNVTDRRNYSHAIVRRLPAEVTIDAILQATANSSRNRSWRNDITARKIAQHPKSIQARGIDYSLLVFGKPLRTTNCDCERQMQPTLLQSLYVRNDREMMQWLHRPDGWLQECLTAAEIDDPTDSPQGDSDSATAAHLDHIVEEAYLRCLSRLPNADERQAARRHLADVSLKDGIEELLWALLNTREFKTNH